MRYYFRNLLTRVKLWGGYNKFCVMWVKAYRAKARTLRAWINDRVFEKTRNPKEITDTKCFGWSSLQSRVPPLYKICRYLYLWSTRLPSDFRVSVKDTVYTFTFEYLRRISHIHGEFRNYSKARTTPHEGCRKKYGNQRVSLRGWLCSLIIWNCRRIASVRSKVLMSRIIRCSLNSRARV